MMDVLKIATAPKSSRINQGGVVNPEHGENCLRFSLSSLFNPSPRSPALSLLLSLPVFNVVGEEGGEEGQAGAKRGGE